MKGFRMREKVPTAARDALAPYPSLLQELLFYRGITTEGEAQEFLNPSYEAHLHDPFLFADMEKAVSRILAAIQKSEPVVIYSDYDCDGIPGGVLAHDFFRKIGYQHAQNYIPHRHEEGYGLNREAVAGFIKNGTRVLITIDCGIADIEAVADAAKGGIDVIIADHHEPLLELPPAFAILNAHRAGETYPFLHLSGAGTAFKLVQALLSRGNFGITPGWEKWLLDMAALSTIADMVPLLGENRAIVHFGLKVMRKSNRPGIRALCNVARLRQRELTEDDVGFMLAPRINAASRMGDPHDAFELLSTGDHERARELAKQLHELNEKRKGTVALMSKEIKRRIMALGEVREVIVMGNPRWRPGLLGLAASHIVEEYERPAFLWGREGSVLIKGSCRSDGTVDVVELMGKTTELFLSFGGHSVSGGFSVSHEKVHLLEESLITSYGEVRNGKNGAEALVVDKEISVDELTWDLYGLIEKLAPFGKENPKPLFRLSQVLLSGAKKFGRDRGHMKLSFQNRSGKTLSAVGFFLKEFPKGKTLRAGETVDLLATLERSTFGGASELRLRIVEVA